MLRRRLGVVDEVVLAGANIDRLVNDGYMIRRVVRPRTPPVHQLLLQFRAMGFVLGPQTYGPDEI